MVHDLFDRRRPGFENNPPASSKNLSSWFLIGSFSGGWLHDRTGSCDSVWWLGAALAVMAAVVHWPIEEKPVLRPAAGSAGG